MEAVKITPAFLSGKVAAPPSKSFAHRAVLAAFLSGGECSIKNIRLSDDIAATLSCIRALGADCRYDKKKKTVTLCGNTETSISEVLRLDCCESGSTLRFIIPVALIFCDRLELTGKGRLMQRPLEPYFKIFREKGIHYSQKDGKLALRGKLMSGDFTVDGNVSSQFITGLLFALPLLDGDSRIIIDGSLASKAYIDITLDVLKKFGIKIINDDYRCFSVKGNQKYKARSYTVEGDFSQAAFFLVAGAIGCDITCTGLNESSLQGDKKILDILNAVGAKLEKKGLSGYCAIHSPDMHGITVDADEIPDLVPILAVLFSFCNGESRIINAGRLRIKESDRLTATRTVLGAMGVDITEGDDFLVIHGRQVLNGASLSSFGDHRIAMAAAVAACRCEGDVIITGAKNAVKKSYPDFFDDYAKLGGKVI